MKPFTLLLFSIILLSVTTSFAQSRLADAFSRDRCDVNFKGHQKAMGLDITMSVPCDWSQSEGRRPHVLNSFTYTFPDKSYLNHILLIRSAKERGPGGVGTTLTDQALKTYYRDFGKVTPLRRTKVAGMPAVEYTVQGMVELPIAKVFLTQLYYVIPYRGKVVEISYAVGSTDVTQCRELAAEYRDLFVNLAGFVIFNDAFD
jgi:hypothetical protein